MNKVGNIGCVERDVCEVTNTDAEEREREKTKIEKRIPGVEDVD